MNFRIKYVVLLLCTLMTLLTLSCKKTNLADNDPNINDIVTDTAAVSAGYGQPTTNVPIDLDEDGHPDFFISAGEPTATDAQTSLVGVPGYVKFLTDTSGFVSPANIATLIDSIPEISPPRPLPSWNDFAKASFVRTGAGGFSLGQANGNDFYLGVFTTKSDGVHYGWLRLIVAADGKSIRLKEFGYHRRPRTALRTSAR